MVKYLLSLSGLLIILLRPGLVCADALQIIIHVDQPYDSLNKQQVANLFLSKPSTSIKQLKPLDREESELRKSFYQQIAELSENRLRAYWAKRVFTGRGRPPATISRSELTESMTDPSMISYIRAENGIPKDMKVVLEIPLEKGK